MARGGVLGALLLLLTVLTFGTAPAAACHKTTDLCMPCDDGGRGCEPLGDLDAVAVLGEVKDKLLPPPATEDMHFVADGSDDERHAYVVLAFEWDTPDHRAPAGHGDVPFEVELSSDDDVDWDGSPTQSFTFSANETGRQTFYFTFAASDEEVVVDYVITAHPGTIAEDGLSGTMTLEEDGSTTMDWRAATAAHWPLLALFLLVGLVLGVLVGRALGRTPP